MPRVEIIGKPDCSLCDTARAVVSRVCADLGEQWAERSILDDPALYDEYWDRIPVTLVDGAVVAVYRVDETALRTTLASGESVR